MICLGFRVTLIYRLALQLAKKLGATHTINYKTNADWDKLVLEVGGPPPYYLCRYSPSRALTQITDGEEAHSIIDNVGINDFEKYMNCVAHEGTITCVGFLGGAPTAAPNIPLLAMLARPSIPSEARSMTEESSVATRNTWPICSGSSRRRAFDPTSTKSSHLRTP